MNVDPVPDALLLWAIQTEENLHALYK